MLRNNKGNFSTNGHGSHDSFNYFVGDVGRSFNLSDIPRIKKKEKPMMLKILIWLCWGLATWAFIWPYLSYFFLFLSLGEIKDFVLVIISFIVAITAAVKIIPAALNRTIKIIFSAIKQWNEMKAKKRRDNWVEKDKRDDTESYY